jgi:hypothetical protein
MNANVLSTGDYFPGQRGWLSKSLKQIMSLYGSRIRVRILRTVAFGFQSYISHRLPRIGACIRECSVAAAARALRR